MREYEFVATNETIEALRLLRQPWAGYQVDVSALRVRLVDGTAIRVDVDGTDLEPSFEALRLAAGPDTGAVPVAERASSFGAGRNDAVVFRGETWIEGAGGPATVDAPRGAVVQYSGRPGQRSDHAAAVCQTTDAVLIASSEGTGILVQLGAVPYRVDVTEDRLAIARFLAQRGYSEG